MQKNILDTKPFFKHPPERFINRELSWLEFNCRVLEEANNKNVPLLERVKFLAISASNLDEFFMVRVAGLKEQVRSGIGKVSQDGLTAAQQLEKIREKSENLVVEQQKCWIHLKEDMKKAGVYIVSKENLSRKDIKELNTYFLRNIFPALSPIAVDPAHPFPFIPNMGLAVVSQFYNEDEKKEQYSIVLLPSKLNRFVRVPGNKERYILLEDVIEIYKDDIFPEKNITGYGVLHLTRDSELEIEEEAEDLMNHFETVVKKRRRGKVIQLKLKLSKNHDLDNFLMKGLGVSAADVIEVDEVPGMDRLMELHFINKPKLKFKPYEERFPERINDFGGDCFAAIAAKDIVIHHPYETFDVVVKLLQQAARDPNVVAIKQTLYRTSNDSPIVMALIEAAEAGKSVTVVVELKARFDEESNIRWARNLERAGAQVVFGFVDLKTHAKVSFIVRRENDSLKSYVHFGTGNYHPVTARTYSDLSYFTCNPILCNDVAYLFNYLTGYSSPDNFASIAVSPSSLRNTVMWHIENEIENAKEGLPAAIWAKMNALIDPDIIDALYKASQAGVSIDLVVRGVCGLRPGIKGFSENIRVKSIVGRFLEHARILCFGGGSALPSENAKVYISSADWMQRNLNGRVEVMVPITNKTVHQQVLEQIMIANLKDEKQSWYLQPDGRYIRKSNSPNDFSAHEYFMTNPSLSGRGNAITEAESEKQRKKIYQLFPFDNKKE
ncbi:MAG: RNA degradosome polyphosphate kinase [Alphaproteobacteria bacterium CG11_big_fil_rev_8_21_14_0_20_39_49]|nr:MAG: RNA degradosome polyphosphate kinase [Alphaproteobacteria bacterium CG11_big_fil_rev_8_21_14_0_20_39_49]